MKKLLSAFCLLLCLAMPASAMDLTGMTDQQLRDLRDQIDTELAARAVDPQPPADLSMLLLHIDGAAVGTTRHGSPVLVVFVRADNNTGKSISVFASVGRQCTLDGVLLDELDLADTVSLPDGSVFQVKTSVLANLPVDAANIRLGFAFRLPADPHGLAVISFHRNYVSGSPGGSFSIPLP